MAKRYSKKDILKPFSKYLSMSREEVYNYAKSAAQLAKERRTKLINGLLEENLPLPPSLQRWSTHKTIPDDFTQLNTKMSEIIGYNNYDRGYGNIDFSVSKDMSKNELLHKLNVSRRFIQAETSTVGGWKSYYNKIIKRIEQRANTSISPSDYPIYWDLYNKVKEIAKRNSQFAGKFEYGKSTEVQQRIAEYMLDYGFGVDRAGELAQILDTEFREEYENIGEEDDDDGFWI